MWTSSSSGPTEPGIRRPTAESILKDLNPPQREAVEHQGSPLLVLAGAGSGKTRVLAHRIAFLICERGFRPDEILAVTFTRKAAQEMADRVRGLLPHVEPTWWMGTFHSVGARILRSLAGHCGRESNFVIYDEDDQLRLLKKILSQGAFGWELTPREAQKVIEQAKQKLVSWESYEERAVGPREQALSEVYGEYERELRAMNAFDFGDLLTSPTTLFQNDAELGRQYASRFREVLVDEYQDTNHAQYAMVAALASHHKALTVVGDDDQSIYAWRGADLSNILDFERGFPQAHTVRLEQNYRSTKNILRIAQALIACNEGRHDKALWTDGPDGELPVVAATDDERAEASLVVREITRLIEKEGRRPGEIAVLYRTNAQSRALEEALRRRAVRYVLVGTLRFFERKEIKDFLAYLRLVANPADEVSLRRVMNFPPRGIGERTVARLAAWAEEMGISLDAAVRRATEIDVLGSRAAERLQRFARLLEDWRRRAKEEPPDKLARGVAEESGLWDHFLTHEGHQAEERRENLREMLASVAEYVRDDPGADLNRYLEEVALSASVDTWEEGGGNVTLMTLHNAKGLEFPMVFITGLEEDLLPHRSARDEGPGRLEEERRLLYVGITRARERLWLTAAANRRSWSGGGRRHLSRFISEIPSEYLVFQECRIAGEKWRRLGDDSQEYGDDPFPSYERDEEPGDWSDPQDISAGQWVHHAQWGRGKVLACEGSGASLKLTILFENGRRKKVLARHAPLELI